MSKERCNTSGFTFIGNNGQKYGYDSNGTPCLSKSNNNIRIHNFTNKNASTIVDQYTINPNTTNSNSTNLHNGFGSTNFSNIGFSEPVSQDHTSSYIKKFNERHDAFEARSKLFTLNKLKDRGEIYTLPYDDKGNLLSGTQIQDKYDAYLKNNPSSSQTKHTDSLGVDKIEEFKEQIKQLDLKINSTFKKTVSYNQPTPQIKEIPYQNKFEDGSKKDFEVLQQEIRELSLNGITTDQHKKYSEINDSLNLLPKSGLHSAINANKSSQNNTQKALTDNISSNSQSTQNNKDELIKALSNKYGKVFVGTTSSFVSNLESVKKSGDSVNTDLNAIHFTYGMEGIGFNSKESIFNQFGFMGTQVYKPVNDEYIGKTIPYLSMFNLNYLCIKDSQIGNKGIAVLMNANLCIKEWNLSNNNIDDEGAKTIADTIEKGDLLDTTIDVSGNHITKTGTGYFIDALKNSTVGNIIIKQYHLSVFGNKESKVAFMKDYLKQAQDKGVNVKNIVVDKSLFGYIKNTGKICKDTVVGFAKCYYVDDAVTDHIKDKIIAKTSKVLGVLNHYNDIINCYAETFDDLMTSPEGIQLIKTDLEVMGESTVINAIE